MLSTSFTRRSFIASLALLPPCLPNFARATTVIGAPPLPLALEAAPDIDPAGFLVSEKYDGVRAIWDGRRLRFRSGLAVSAPDWFVARLPASPLDGELWLARGRFEALMGTVRRQVAHDEAWSGVCYMVFELPRGEGDFKTRCEHIRTVVQQADCAWLVAVPQATLASRQALAQRLDEVIRGGGEGLMLHRADARYTTGRSRSLLKLKPLHDAEAQVVAHVAGRGKHAGRLGALRVRTPAGVQFFIGTGFSDAQRESPPPLGAVVSFTHRGFTNDGVPRFASFLRVHEV